MVVKKKQIDDEANIQEALHGILTDEGYEVCEAENGDDALKLLQEKRIDLVLLDIWLPGRRDGLQTLREMRRRHENAEVIMISGHGSIDTAVRATKLGAYGFIEKPLSLTVVLDRIEAALQGTGENGKDNQPDSGYDRYIGGCETMQTVKRRMESAAKSGEPILIIGEMGSGKEFSAEHVHTMSSRKNDPFITVNCNGLAAPAFNRLFGAPDENPASKGSRFSKLAGSLFLEDPHKLDNELQERLFNIVTFSKIRRGKNRLGFIAAATAIRKKRGGFGLPPSLSDVFGNDPIILPPLRERGDDIENFINYFIENASEDFGKSDIKFSRDTVSRMVKYPWSGNVKELKTLVENSVMSCTSAVIGPGDIQLGGPIKKKTALPALGGGRRGGSNRRSIINQKSLKQSVVLTGVGLHSGIKTGLILTPLPPNSGIIFGDISTGRQVPANLDNVRSTEFCTMLKFGAARVMTIEHIMATLHMYGITNALIKVGDEVPIMDGSAAELCELIENAGIKNQHETMVPITVDRKITIGEPADDKKFLTIEPADRLIIEYRMDYPPPVGKMKTTFKADSVENFKTEIAPARTFGFVDEIKKIAKKGFAKGGRLTNVILIDDERVINTSLRFEDEFARHKILDFIGDAYLLGRPLYGKVTANMTGHTENVMLLNVIRSSLDMPGNGASGRA
ncbi:MAG: UDP-3-O-acyl-N-acetylglucosamine deacetylase [Nitrospinota bacterium]